jgi:hypothetical protein
MDFDILSQIPRLLKELISIVQEPLEARKKRRNEFFSVEIAPIHESMKAINEDYMSSFSELLDLLESPRDIARTIELLKKKRLVLVAKRKDILAYGEVLEATKKHGYIRQKEIDAFVKFAESIRNYMKGASPVDSRFTWFSGFIDEFESLIRRGVSPFETPRFSSIESSVSPVDLVKKAYSEAVHNDIPEAWKQYSKNFHALRLELTR